jgi:hypothetical protein
MAPFYEKLSVENPKVRIGIHTRQPSLLCPLHPQQRFVGS